MKNSFEIKNETRYQDPPNMNRAGFWSWTDERIGKEQTGQQIAPDVTPVVKPIAIDRLNPTR